MNTTPDPSDAIRRLESAGAEPRLAQAIASLLTTAARPTPGALITDRASRAIPTIVVPFLIAAMGWFVVDEIRQTRSELTAAINASTTRIEALREQFNERTAGLGERLTRVETLIQERLPPAP